MQFLISCSLVDSISSIANSYTPHSDTNKLRAAPIVEHDPNCAVSQDDYDAFPSPAKPLIWDRIRENIGINLDDNPRVAKERNRYLRSPEGIKRILTRGQPYLFHIVEQLESQGMPLAIALLPAVESGFEPFAYSHGRAAGIWQFIPGTGKMLGLDQNWWYDARRDIVRSTEAAQTYLMRHHKRFDNDWLLALASYNSGAGNVSKAVKKNKRKQQPIDFWNLSLPKETLAYVPRLIALNQIILDPSHYGIDLPDITNEPYFAQVDVGSQIDLSQVAKLAQISMDELYQLNPAFNQWATHPKGPHSILIPLEKQNKFQQELAKLPKEKRVTWQRYTIRQGDSLSTIAKRFNIDISTLKNMNNISGSRIRAGKKMIVPVPSQNDKHYSKSIQRRLEQKQKSIGKQSKRSRINHVVKTGDSFWLIGKRYGVKGTQVAKWNNMAPADLIRPGQTLAVWTQTPPQAALNNGVIRKVSYTVKAGDSLDRIANKFKLKINDILSWNPINPKKYIQPGDSLTLFVDVTRTN